MKNFKINKKNEIKIIKLKEKDFRGYFRRLFCADELNKIISKKITQINHSFTKKKGTIRGLHYQVKPFEEIKIILCIKGKIFDVMINKIKNQKIVQKNILYELKRKCFNCSRKICACLDIRKKYRNNLFCYKKL